MKLISIPSFNLKKFHSGLLYGLIVVDSLDVKHKLINIKYIDKALINKHYMTSPANSIHHTPYHTPWYVVDYNGKGVFKR